ncbi:response regulator transcription factor [Cellulomonas cellasea]|uniref:Sensory transduction protein RegX3 n=2 Tax=Cellulomonas cellasea TaxID=43670 RepID=A0A0A0B9C0_9CELL|nr:response regulator transcription factor [Cellulomonas cellasea]KGM02399.1 XRE family transcriptional regulator [Cellulomonas cellasea DSM 20118]GEA88135.1 sensory transduction protein regX3 [Cellulomonas cellasea]
MTRILLVEDEESYRDPLTYQLEREGFEVVTAATGPEALERFADGGADLVLLDLMLPGLSGTEVCRELRRTSDVPVIMLTAKDGEIDKVVGLEIGADDYVTKPYSFRELLARVRAVLRRRGAPAAASAPADDDLDDGTLEVGPVRLDVERHTVHVRGALVAFPLKEFELLELLLRNAGRVLTRGQLIDRIWGSDYVGDTKTLDVHVKRVRAKIEDDPANPTMLQTVRGLGYKIADTDEAS